MSPLPQRVALVTGVNGISGNAIVEHLIRQPKTEWAKIVVTSRKPLPQSWQDDRIEFFALDLLWSQDQIITAMKPHCSEVTHAFYTSYVHTDDFTQLPKYNVPLWENFLVALENVAGTSLQRLCLQTGGKNYGAHLGPGPVPYQENAPRYDDKGENFYYKQEDFMFARQKEAASRGHNWHYSIIRPNGIIGFTPAANGMSEAITMALYFLISRELGQNAEFPGNEYFYNCVDDASSAKGIADISVWAVTEEHTKDEAFNYVNGDTYVWKYFWPRIAAYFGAEVKDSVTVGNSAQGGTKMKHTFMMSEWASDKRQVWDAIVERYGGEEGSVRLGHLEIFRLDNRKELASMTKARRYGYQGYEDTYECYVETFKSFENFGALPPRHRVMSSDNAKNGDAVKMTNGIK